MQQDKYINMLLKFNSYQITEEEFVKYLNSEEELQKIFNKSLKSYLAPSDKSIVDRINEDFSKIGTPQDKFTADTHTSTSSFSIHFFVKELIAKKYFKLLSKEEVEGFILSAITNMSWLYDAEQHIENFIKINIIDSMPKFNKSNDAISYAKSKTKELFTCENKMPSWVQSCEWPFDKNGQPMKFISQKKIGDKVEYYFKSTDTNENKTIVQYY